MTVAKLQVGLLGDARRLQKQLDRIAGRADTNTPSGLHYILQGADYRSYLLHSSVQARNRLSWVGGLNLQHKKGSEMLFWEVQALLCMENHRL